MGFEVNDHSFRIENGSEDQIHKIVKFGSSKDDACSERSFEFTVMVSIHSWGVIFGLKKWVWQPRKLQADIKKLSELFTPKR